MCVIRPSANRVHRNDNRQQPDDNRQQQAMENIVNIATGRRMLFAVIAVFALFFLLTVATLILTITRMSVKDRTEGASKVKGDFYIDLFLYSFVFPSYIDFDQT